MNNSKLRNGTIFLMAAVLVTGTISMIIPSSFAQPYYEDHYNDPYAKDDRKKSTDANIQKIRCINENTNLNGVDLNQIQDPNGLGAVEAQGLENGPTDPNGNGLLNSDGINFDKNLVSICVNVNLNEQATADDDGQTCEDCFTILDEQVIGNLLMTIDAILDSLQVEAQINTLEDLCDFLETSTAISSQEKWQILNTALGSESLPRSTIDNILQCLEDLGIIVEPA